MISQYSHIVLGLGATGLSVVRYLTNKGITPLVMDTRALPPSLEQLKADFPQVELFVGDFDGRYIMQAKQVLVSPGIAVDTPLLRDAIAKGVDVIGDVELFARAIADSDANIIGITGSNGKSTVTTLVGEIAKAAGVHFVLGGNIGVPVLDLLDQDYDLIVLELSSFQLESTSSLNCASATCLNISEDHMDRYADLEAYRRAKLRIYSQAKRVIFNRDDSLTRPDNEVSQNSFGLSVPKEDEWGISDGMLVHGLTEYIAADKVALVGRHNQANLLAAMALADSVDLPRAAMIEVAGEFKGLEHRCELVAVRNGVRFVNDSKATNVGATVAALQSLLDDKNALFLIAGGDSKGADFSLLKPLLKKVNRLITLGKNGDQLAALVENAVPVASMKDAVNQASRLAKDGDIVLLSPACASYDMYRDFIARGEDFRVQVAALNSEVPYA